MLQIQALKGRERQRIARRVGLNFLKYWAIFGVSLRNSFAYLVEALARIVFLGLILFILAQMWELIYGQGGGQRLAGYSLNEILWYLCLTEMFTTTRPAFHLDIDKEVRSGELAYVLGRPYNYMFYQFAVYLGARLVRMVISLVLAAAIIFVLAGPPPFLHPENIVGGLFLMLFAVVVDFLAVFILAIQSFWAEDTSAFVLIYTRVMMVLGGMLIPLDIFPEPLSSIAKALPFSYVLYLPARLTVKFDWGLFGEAVLKLSITTLVLGALALFILGKVERRMSTNGG
jgi:ABC-2 type transport system permease protein